MLQIDIYVKSVDLLEKIANSVIDRDQSMHNVLFFNTNEIQIVEHWLRELIKEVCDNKKSPECFNPEA